MKTILAYSGGLDTSVILGWLMDQGYEVHCVYVDLGQPCEDRRAIRHYRRALATSPDLPVAARNLALILATARDPALRDAPEAVHLAEHALRTHRLDPTMWEALGVTQAAVGR